MQKIICGVCRKELDISEFAELSRYYRCSGPAKRSLVIVKQPEQGESYCCRRCVKKPKVMLALKSYKSMNIRNKTRFHRDVQFSFIKFWLFLQETDYFSIMAKRKKKNLSVGFSPCIDRINTWDEYSLTNIQVITHSDNSSKNNSPALGARKLTMRFFKKIRESKGLTKYEMALFLGMIPSTYYYYEDQAKGCSFEILCLIRRKLELSWERIGTLIEDEFEKRGRHE